MIKGGWQSLEVCSRSCSPWWPSTSPRCRPSCRWRRAPRRSGKTTCSTPSGRGWSRSWPSPAWGLWTETSRSCRAQRSSPSDCGANTWKWGNGMRTTYFTIWSDHQTVIIYDNNYNSLTSWQAQRPIWKPSPHWDRTWSSTPRVPPCSPGEQW